MILTAEQIAEKCEHLEGEKARKAIRKLYHAQDDSHLWPVRGKFNGTTRAAKQVAWFENQTGQYYEGLEYCLALEHHMVLIVNNEKKLVIRWQQKDYGNLLAGT